MGDSFEDNVDSDVEEVVLLSDLPQHYQYRLTELSTVIKSLFAIGNCDEGGVGVDSDVLTFLEMCHQVFDLDFNLSSTSLDIGHQEEEQEDVGSSSLPSAAADLLNKLMTKYRSFFRKRYRGFTYLTPKALEDTFQLAYSETKAAQMETRKSVSPTASGGKIGIMSLLRKGMLQEFQWLQKINDFKRQELLDSIKNEVIQDFEVTIRSEFPSAFEEDDVGEFGTTFYEEGELALKADRLVNSSVEEFKMQVPYEEEPEELQKLCQGLETELKDKLVHCLVEKNSRNKENAESFMERLVDHSTKLYREKIFKFIQKGPIVEPDQVLCRHIALDKELKERFEQKESRFPNRKLHDQFLKLLNEGIHESLKDILTRCSENGALMLEECEKRGKVELDKCMRKIAKIFGDYGLSQYFDDLCEKVEANLKESLDEIRHCTIINVEKMEETLENAKLPVATADDEDTKLEENADADDEEEIAETKRV